MATQFETLAMIALLDLGQRSLTTAEVARAADCLAGPPEPHSADNDLTQTQFEQLAARAATSSERLPKPPRM
ncbi:hypothetical protein [Arthrobacter dokdonensis]|uniref:hypothetical protein n=1 Tax=Arthrobacter dokdonellae TaxID=2211210 RepID=UPI000DE5960A|nr:hypothetical protein [Arthrobacter dokdonellae]